MADGGKRSVASPRRRDRCTDQRDERRPIKARIGWKTSFAMVNRRHALCP